METSNRYIIVSNSGRGRNKGYKILDLERMELSSETWDYKPLDECLALNKKENGVTVIEFSPVENIAQQNAQRIGGTAPGCTCNAYQLENFGCKCGAEAASKA